MPEIQQPDIVGNYLANYYGAQDRVQKQADRQYQMQRQQVADDQQAQQFQWTKEQHDMAAKADAVSEAIMNIRPGDAAAFDAAKQSLLAKGIITPQEAAQYDINHLQDLQMQSEKWRQVKAFQLQQQQGQAQIEASRASTQHSLAATQALRDKGNGTGGTIDNTTFDNISNLRKEFVAGTKDYQSVRDAYGRIKASAQNPSAAGDLSLIFNYMKVLDPGSTVREGEFATAQNAAGIPERILNAYNNALKGERLNDNQRNDFVNRAGLLFKRQDETYRASKANYEGLAKRFGFDPSLVTLDQSAGLADEFNQPPAPQTFTGSGVFTNGMQTGQAPTQPAAPRVPAPPPGFVVRP